MSHLATAAGPASHMPTGNEGVNTAEGSDRTVSDVEQTPGVDVAAGEAEFNSLSRALSKEAREQYNKDGTRDPEKILDDEDFDLLEYLQATNSAASQAGIKRKRVGVVWENLEVLGAASMSLGVRTFPDAIIQNFGFPIFTVMKAFGAKMFNPGQRKLLQNFSGSVKPGQMVLVLGRPGSGCSTFLQTISNNRSGYQGVNGDVSYGGMDSKLFAKRFSDNTVYCQEDDEHYPTLTVAQTLTAALRLKTPGQLLPGQTKKSFRERTLKMMLKTLGIEDTYDVLVGSAFVRGVSGGQRKRVSIAEVLCTRAAVVAWDNSSRGLDASTALDYAKAMRMFTNILGWSTFISLYQAGEGIWDQFDKILVISDGRCIYFGPRQEARQYFIDLGYEDMPRSTSGDYLTACTDPQSRRFQQGRDESNVPSTPEQMEQAYQQSDIYKREQQEKDAYKKELEADHSLAEEFQQAVVEDKHKGVRPKSKYTVNYATQIKALWIRQVQMILGDKLDIAVSYITAISLSLIIGSLFYSLPQTAAAAFSRGGVLFIALLFNSLTAFSELPTQMGGRPILYRQAGFGFYRPSALIISQLLADLPTGVPRVFLFSLVIFFMAGLRQTAGSFFTYFINILIGYYSFRALFSLFGTISRSYDTAARLAAVIISTMVMFAGYVIPRDAMARWLFWLSYMNPVYYNFEALMLNEFKGLQLACVDANITPRGPGYPATVGANQVCTLPGAVPGSQTVDGLAYLNASFGYKLSNLWLNFGIACIFFFGFTAITCLCVEIMEQGSFASAFVVRKKPNAEEAKLDEALAERRTQGDARVDADLDVRGRAFTFENLSYTVPVKGGQRKLLNSVNGYVRPGTLTALMGASGAGKTTLLDVLADRKSVGVIEGDRLIEGKPVDISFQRGCGYAEQQDIHEHTATVREALRFSAYLRQDASVSIEDKNAFVESIIELLELHDIANASIGFPAFGLGVTDRKRVTIAVELAAKPDQLLFLDEPTSGLDGQGAYTIVRLLRKLANSGMTILCTIHQPSSMLFELFDRLLLLKAGGNTVYFGDVGKDSAALVKYFEEQGAPMAKTANPAEAMLEIIGAGSQKRVGDRDWADVYADSQLCKNNLAEIQKIKEECLAAPAREGEVKEYATSYSFQLKTVLKRTLVSSWRQPDYQFTRLFQHGALALVTGLIFLQLGNNLTELQYRVFAVFIATVLPALILSSIEPFYIMARGTYMREASSKMYQPTVFALSQIISEIPFGVLCAVVYFLLFYFPAGFQSDSNRAGFFIAFIMLSEVFAITLGQAIAAWSPSIYLASIWNPFLILIFSLFCGVTIPKPQMTYFWRQWMYWVNPLTYMVSSLVTNELHDLPVVCTASELSTFQPPSGQTCAEWAGSFLTAAGGYLSNPNATADCGYCQYSVGDDFTDGLDIRFNERGRNIGIFVVFVGFNVLAVLAGAKFTRFANR